MSTRNYDTIEDQVKSESTYDLGFRVLTSQLTITDIKSGDSIVVPYESIVNKYRYFLEDYIQEIELDEIQYETFRQNPHALSEALYGTTQFWHVLLELNHCVSRVEFNLRKVKYYSPNSIITIINEVLLKGEQENEININ